MRISVANTADRYLPEWLTLRLHPFLQMADSVLSSADDNALAQRMALNVFAIRVASAIIAFASQVLLARWLGTFQYGVFVAVWVALLVLVSVGNIGFSSAALRLVAEYRQRKRPRHLQGAIDASMLISFFAAVLVAIIGAAILFFTPDLVEPYYIAPIYLAILCLPILSIESTMSGVGQAFNWTNVAFLPMYIIRPLGILFVMGCALLMGFEANAVTAMWSGVIACYTTATVQFILLAKNLRREAPRTTSKYRIRHWTLIAFPLFVVEGFYVLQTSADIMIVSAYLTPEDAGIYFAATKILALVHFVYFAVRSAAAQRYTGFHKAGNIDAFRAFVQKTVTWTFWPSLMLAAVMMVLGKYFLALFGPEFVSGQPIIWVLAIGIVIRSSVGPAESLLAMADSQNVCAAIYAVALCVNVALNITLIPVYGLVGAATATTFALAFESLALHAMVKRRLKIHAFIIPERRIAQDAKS